MGLLPRGANTSGQAHFNDADLLVHQHAESARGRNICMIFQEPMTALTPVLTIGRQMTEAAVFIGGKTQRAAETRALEVLDQVGIDGGRLRLAQYPHELSGGIRQRVMIAMAMMNEPQLMIADEPTSALDVSIQARILDLLRDLKTERSLAMLFISHDLAVVRTIADRVVVMRAGHVLESGPTQAVLSTPRHPYTCALTAAAPVPDPVRRNGKLRPTGRVSKVCCWSTRAAARELLAPTRATGARLGMLDGY